MTVEAPPTTDSGGNPLTKKLGPLPAWGWGVAIGGGFILFRIVTGKSAFPSAGGTPTPVGATVNPTIPGSEMGTGIGSWSASDIAALKSALGLDSQSGPASGGGFLTGAAGASVCGPIPLFVQKPGTTRVCIPGLGWRDIPTGIPTAGGATAAPSTTRTTATVDFAGSRTAFGTVYPATVHTLADAIAWYFRAIRAGAKPKTAFSTVPVH